MSNGHIDKAEVEAILSGGQPAVNKFVVESVIHLKHGQETQRELLEDVVEKGVDRERRLGHVERWTKDWEANCPERMKKAILAADEEADRRHEVIHAAHMAGFHPDRPKRSGDANGENHTEQRHVDAVLAPIEKKMWVLWGIFIFVVIEAGHALVMWAVERAAGN